MKFGQVFENIKGWLLIYFIDEEDEIQDVHINVLTFDLGHALYVQSL